MSALPPTRKLERPKHDSQSRLLLSLATVLVDEKSRAGLTDDAGGLMRPFAVGWTEQRKSNFCLTILFRQRQGELKMT